MTGVPSGLCHLLESQDDTWKKSINLSDFIWKLTHSPQNLGIFIYKIKADLLKPLRMIFGPPEKVKRSSTDVGIRMLLGYFDGVSK